jgi:hypothetical protein
MDSPYRQAYKTAWAQGRRTGAGVTDEAHAREVWCGHWGTFTDIVFLGENGQLHIKKVFSSVDNYAQALASLPTPGVYFGPQIGWLGMPV